MQPGDPQAIELEARRLEQSHDLNRDLRHFRLEDTLTGHAHERHERLGVIHPIRDLIKGRERGKQLAPRLHRLIFLAVERTIARPPKRHETTGKALGPGARELLFREGIEKRAPVLEPGRKHRRAVCAPASLTILILRKAQQIIHSHQRLALATGDVEERSTTPFHGGTAEVWGTQQTPDLLAGQLAFAEIKNLKCRVDDRILRKRLAQGKVVGTSGVCGIWQHGARHKHVIKDSDHLRPHRAEIRHNDPDAGCPGLEPLPRPLGRGSDFFQRTGKLMTYHTTWQCARLDRFYGRASAAQHFEHPFLLASQFFEPEKQQLLWGG